MKTRRQGYALVACVAALAAFAYLAFDLTAGDRGDSIAAIAITERARMQAAADAGLVLALQGLTIEDRTRRWAIDGKRYVRTFNGATLTISVEDEWAKISLGSLFGPAARRLFEAAGVTGARLDVLADSLADWIDSDDYVESSGAESAYYAPEGIRPRNSGIISLDELVRIRGMDAELLERVRPALTVSTRLGAIFVRENASPLALATRTGIGPSSAQQRAQAGQRPALSIAENENLAGRPLSIVITVRLPSGASISRVTVVELTGKPSPAYQVRSSDWR
ncbi:MAG: hypothetical protein E6R12_00235 [Sphingomonadales bacterium]|nr:MAG: hypothetical protein E6R12_00235 [Sphingomonadales bacterium]